MLEVVTFVRMVIKKRKHMWAMMLKCDFVQPPGRIEWEKERKEKLGEYLIEVPQ